MNQTPPNTDDWHEYKLWVVEKLSHIDSLYDKLDKIESEVHENSKKLAALNARAGVVGFLAGLVATILSAFTFHIK